MLLFLCFTLGQYETQKSDVTIHGAIHKAQPDAQSGTVRYTQPEGEIVHQS